MGVIVDPHIWQDYYYVDAIAGSKSRLQSYSQRLVGIHQCNMLSVIVVIMEGESAVDACTRCLALSVMHTPFPILTVKHPAVAN